MHPNHRELSASQIPALELLMQLGYTYVSVDECTTLRGGNTSQVILTNLLKTQLARINRGRFSDSNLDRAIHTLSQFNLNEGLTTVNQKVYDLLTAGISLEERQKGRKRHLTLSYIDWKKPENNAFHVTQEFSVGRQGNLGTYRPDIVAFVNGIPFLIIECKQSAVGTTEGIDQHLRNQQPNGIPQLYAYSQLLLSISVDEARYATTTTPKEFWSQWKEDYPSKQSETKALNRLRMLKNKGLSTEQQKAVFGDSPYSHVRMKEYKERGIRQLTPQDRYLYHLCRPSRLLELTRDFCLFDGKQKKIARYQQYFAIHRTLNRVRDIQENGKRKGGYIWHTQGSGKSITMVLLSRLIRKHSTAKNPQVVIVTDRTNLDLQIKATFERAADRQKVLRANSGKQLAAYLQSEPDAILTTLVHKFEQLPKQKGLVLDSPNIFVFIDESHRTQYGELSIAMRQTLPNACFIGFTGTPLFKDQKTQRQFGTAIHQYTIDQAVEDGAILSLRYEARHVEKEVLEDTTDQEFAYVSENLSEGEKEHLKKQNSTIRKVLQSKSVVRRIALDITKHLCEYARPLGLKAQLVTSNKETALRYKELFDEYDKIHSAVIISEDNASTHGYKAKLSERIVRHWQRIKARSSVKEYERSTIASFKSAEGEVELIIVVDKLLTGFDAPINGVLYVTRSLKDHTLLQAIARVNRLYKDKKQYGLIVDYFGNLGHLDKALTDYSALNRFDAEDLGTSLVSIEEEIGQLVDQYAALLALFESIENKRDDQAYKRLLQDEDKRKEFYECLQPFLRTWNLARTSQCFHEQTDRAEIARYREAVKYFSQLKVSLQFLHNERLRPDALRELQGQMQAILDHNIVARNIQRLIEPVDILNKTQFEEALHSLDSLYEKAVFTASRIEMYLVEHQKEDPVYYKKLSQRLKEAIEAHKQQQLSDRELKANLHAIKARLLLDKLSARYSSGSPFDGYPRSAKAFYHTLQECYPASRHENLPAFAIKLHQKLVDCLSEDGQPIVDWERKKDITNQLEILIEDTFEDSIDFHLTWDAIDTLIPSLIDLLKESYAS